MADKTGAAPMNEKMPELMPYYPLLDQLDRAGGPLHVRARDAIAGLIEMYVRRSRAASPSAPPRDKIRALLSAIRSTEGADAESFANTVFGLADEAISLMDAAPAQPARGERTPDAVLGAIQEAASAFQIASNAMSKVQGLIQSENRSTPPAAGAMEALRAMYDAFACIATPRPEAIAAFALAKAALAQAAKPTQAVTEQELADALWDASSSYMKEKAKYLLARFHITRKGEGEAELEQNECNDDFARGIDHGGRR